MGERVVCVGCLWWRTSMGIKTTKSRAQMRSFKSRCSVGHCAGDDRHRRVRSTKVDG